MLEPKTPCCGGLESFLPLEVQTGRGRLMNPPGTALRGVGTGNLEHKSWSHAATGRCCHLRLLNLQNEGVEQLALPSAPSGSG